MERSKIRAFLALNLPAGLKARLDSLIKDLSLSNKGVKWVRAGDMHITLHFICFLDRSLVDSVKKLMASKIGRIGEIELELGDISFFPNTEMPRVIFLECTQTNGKSAFTLQEILGRELSQIGIQIDDRSWQPHITLGRIKESRVTVDNGHILAGEKFTIRSLELMESKLSSNGPEYRVLASYEL